MTFFKGTDLTDKMKEHLKLYADGETYRTVAVKLGVTPHVANRVKRNILNRLGCDNITHAVATALRFGLIA